LRKKREPNLTSIGAATNGALTCTHFPLVILTTIPNRKPRTCRYRDNQHRSDFPLPHLRISEGKLLKKASAAILAFYNE
jgi:hypothetical protein